MSAFHPSAPATVSSDATVELQRRDWIAGLEKGLAMIEVFDAEHSRMTATEVAQRCGLTRTAARRHLLTLAHLGYVDTDGKLFWLTPRILRLGQAYLDSARLPRAVQPYLQRVTSGTGETAFAAVLDHDEVVYIARSGSQRQLNTGYMLGSRVQAHVTAAGMAILGGMGSVYRDAWLQLQTLRPFTSHTVMDKEALRQSIVRARDQGWAISEQQLEVNFRGIAVPLYDHNDSLLGAMSVTMPMNNETAEVAVKRILPVLQDTARAMRPML
ncbi:IclR family transcriptional regulator C-terminal domain-containing protein [Hydrogenophaga sp.]|uniref:IclR family transcriptional regulator domain-containing protein n=1 Tax=Hydrogenophaga sp. TaxID=1904254 RepID=UPI00271B6B0A|nr:IclR family transcriptional regulator C-terminal domain-containing protein [Hydrogenophaga sp.]MDO9438316.1 IclR family transcriptional regulator C-terminal domain-containing protein [Hydrogenophaga sp.]